MGTTAPPGRPAGEWSSLRDWRGQVPARSFPSCYGAPLLISAEPLTIWGWDMHYHLPCYFPIDTTWEFHQDTQRSLVVCWWSAQLLFWLLLTHWQCPGQTDTERYTFSPSGGECDTRRCEWLALGHRAGTRWELGITLLMLSPGFTPLGGGFPVFVPIKIHMLNVNSNVGIRRWGLWVGIKT